MMRAVAVAAAGMMLLAACRSNTPTEQVAGGAPTPVTVDVCDLLTAAEVEDAFGRPVSVEAATDVDCNYTTTDADVLESTELTTTVLSPAGVQPEMFPSVVAAGVGTDYSTQQLDRPGDAALLSTNGDSAILNVLTGTTWLTLTVIAPDEPDRSAETLTHLADLAVQRLV
jgi:hypothetical protein